MSNNAFGIVDYVIFGIMLASSASIGIYYRFTGGRQKTTREYLLANGNMSVLPVAFSLMASLMSAVTLLGVSAENYIYGTQFIVINISYIIGTPICAYVFLPVFFKARAMSSYQYLELRFGRPTRLLASSVFIFQMVTYMAIVLYAPALALSSVTGVDQWTSILSVGIVCTFYCTIGGMKAVLWTDVLQSILMFAGLFGVIIKGTIDIGGIGNVFHIASEGGRLNLFNFDLNPFERHTVWTLAIGGIFVFTSLLGVNQAQVQRLLTVKDLKTAQLALFLNWPITSLLSLVTSFTGLVIYANLSSCDPLLRAKETNIQRPDQLLPYYVMKSLGSYPGLPGLFVAGIFSGTLSTVSSAVNSLAAVTLEDFIRPVKWSPNFVMTDSKATCISKVLAFSYGILCVLLTFVADQLGGILQASLTLFGVVGGPLLGLFTLGMLVKFSNQKGAISGFLISLSVCLWVGFGTIAAGVKTKGLPLSEAGCFSNETTTGANYSIIFQDYSSTDSSCNSTLISDSVNEHVFWLYRLSYMWYAGLGWLLMFVVGCIVSLATGGTKHVNRELLSPVLNSSYFCQKKESWDIQLPLKELDKN